MSDLTVTVIIGAYNAMPYLTRCLESVAEQSLGTYELECVAVDDGSTDGTGQELDRFAAEHSGTVRVVHQQNSEGRAAHATSPSDWPGAATSSSWTPTTTSAPMRCAG